MWKQRSYCFMDLQKEAYPQQFQQATEIVVLLFSSHIDFVLESELKNSNKFLGATLQVTFGLLFDPPQGKSLFNSHLHKALFYHHNNSH